MLLAAWRNIKMNKENIGYGLPMGIPFDLTPKYVCDV